MRFLWLAKDLPMRADTGAHIYSNGLIRSLLATGATGTLICYAPAGETPGTIAGLTVKTLPYPRRNRAFSLLSKLQNDAYRLRGTPFASLVDASFNEMPDAVVIDYFAMGWALPIVEAARKNGRSRAILVYISHNYEATLRHQVAASEDNPLMRQVLRMDAEKAARLELRLGRAADLVVANTDDDAQAYRRVLPDKTVLTLLPAYDGEIAATRTIDADVPRRVVITGSFEWIAKQSALRRFVHAAEGPFRREGIELLVVGRVPESLAEELSAQSKVCRFTGWVDDVRPYLRNARIGVMPDEIGGGFKHKYLYYIFAGLPVATIRSQVAGLPVDVDEDLIACDSVKDLVQAIVHAIDDIPRLNKLRETSWSACASAFSWPERGRMLREAIDALRAGQLAKRSMLR